MATVADKITAFRQLADDPVELGYATLTSDGAALTLSLAQRPIIAVNYVKDNATTLTLTTHYTVSADTGVINLVTPITSAHTIKVSYSYATLSDNLLFNAFNAAREAAYPWLRQEIDTELTTENIAVTGAKTYSLTGLAVRPRSIVKIEEVDAATGGTILRTFTPGTYELTEDEGRVSFKSGYEPTATTSYLRVHYYAPLTPYTTLGDTVTDLTIYDAVWQKYLWKTAYEYLAAHWSLSKEYVNRRLPGTNPALLKSLADSAAREYQEACVSFGRTQTPYDRPSRTLSEPEQGENYRE